ncbi:hypothetical protein HAX54_034713 [Datura stramonium]|uniref:Uncharacterized protein n=1 Tax=Datura stramonium TaxID=4076 RepID=A0ABS8SEF8_DATST|nr:hypothetical protein [Datura stramonium]
MTKLKGREVSLAEGFEETHKKKKKDGTREGWVELRAEEAYVGFQRDLDEWRQTQPTSEDGSSTQPSFEDITSIWTEVTSGVKKGIVYGLGVQPSSCFPSPLLSSASTSQCLEVIEAMRRQIEEQTQQCETFDANFAKIQKFMNKHMPIYEEEEETESDEE